MTTARFVFGISAWALCLGALLAVPSRLERERALRAETESARIEGAAANRKLAALAGEKRILMEALAVAARDAAEKQASLELLETRLAGLGKERDEAQAELVATRDRLDKAWRDIAEMEKQIVEVSRAKNEIEKRLALHGGKPPHPVPPEEETEKIDGIVLGVSDKVNLVLISVGGKDHVKVGDRFTVYRGNTYVTKLVVDKVDDQWAACRELKEFQKETIQQGDSVSTKVFDK